MTAQLEYMGRPMRLEPTEVICLQSHGPLESPEPRDADILELLNDDYAVFVELQPGDGTRYGLVLTGNSERFTVMRVGSRSEGAVTVARGITLTPAICTPLAPSNDWTRVFFAWWLNALVRVQSAEALP